MGDSLLLANWEPTELSKKPPPEEAFVGAACLGAVFLGDSLLLSNWEPTELSKNPPPEDALVGEDCLGAGAAFLGDSARLANWAPTELSKNPFEAPARQLPSIATFSRYKVNPTSNPFNRCTGQECNTPRCVLSA